MSKRKIRMGMVGGGRGAFIGTVHRMAATLDNEIELVCGAFSSDPKRSKLSGQDWYLPKDRVYGSWKEMIETEKTLPADKKMDFISIVTPNHLHFPVAMAGLKNGFHVVSDKPMTFDLKEARQLHREVQKSGLVFAITYNYTGYPMAREARELIKSGKLGKIRKVAVEYPQGWLAGPLEATGQKQAAWRTDPKQAGASCCIGDIGTHAVNMAEYMTGLEISEVCAEISTFVSGRKLDDDGNMLLRFKGGARGVLMASQISIDEENGLAIRVYGEKGGLEWHQEEPNTLILKWPGKNREVVRAGGNYAGRQTAATQRSTRLPAGHPEGYLEAFANIYREFAEAVRTHGKKSQSMKKPEFSFPSSLEGLRGMAFIEAATKSAKSAKKWTKMPKV